MGETKGIKSWSPDDRPREKLALKGASALSDAELIAILIGMGNSEESAVDLSRKILLSVSGDLNKLGSLSLKDLTNFRGIGAAKAITIMAALELGKRKRAQSAKTNSKVNSSRLAYERFLEHMSGLKHEEFWVMCLSSSANVLTIQKVSEGGLTATLVDPKRIFRVALECHAAKIIIAHNHPSGNLKPSNQDEKLTKRLLETSRLLECTLEDHLIVTDTGYFSFTDEGILGTV